MFVLILTKRLTGRWRVDFKRYISYRNLSVCENIHHVKVIIQEKKKREYFFKLRDIV